MLYIRYNNKVQPWDEVNSNYKKVFLVDTFGRFWFLDLYISSGLQEFLVKCSEVQQFFILLRLIPSSETESLPRDKVSVSSLCKEQ